MPTSLSAAMRTEMQDHPNRVHAVIEMVFDSQEFRFAQAWVASESKGVYQKSIQSIESTESQANFSDLTLPVPRFAFSIYDEDRVLQKLFAGDLRGRISTGTVEVWWRSNYVDAADHYKAFAGIVIKPAMSGDRVYNFSATASISALERPLAIPIFPQAHFPTAPERSHGEPLWTVYGKNYSSGIADSFGLISCLPLEEAANGDVDLWLASYGQLSAITRVTFDDADRSSDFTNGVIQRGGNLYHVLTYTGGSPHPDASTKIRIDCDGLSDTSPTTGTVITNPAAMMRHVLANFAFGSGDVRPATSWASETGIAIATSVWDLTEDYYRFRNIGGGMVVYGDDTGLSVLNRWCSDHRAIPFLADGWKVGASPRDFSITGIYLDSSHVAQLIGDAQSPLTFDSERSESVTDLDVNYHYDSARNAFARSSKISYRRSSIASSSEKFSIKYGTHTVFEG